MALFGLFSKPFGYKFDELAKHVWEGNVIKAEEICKDLIPYLTSLSQNLDQLSTYLRTRPDDPVIKHMFKIINTCEEFLERSLGRPQIFTQKRGLPTQEKRSSYISELQKEAMTIGNLYSILETLKKWSKTPGKVSQGKIQEQVLLAKELLGLIRKEETIQNKLASATA